MANLLEEMGQEMEQFERQLEWTHRIRRFLHMIRCLGTQARVLASQPKLWAICLVTFIAVVWSFVLPSSPAISSGGLQMADLAVFSEQIARASYWTEIWTTSGQGAAQTLLRQPCHPDLFNCSRLDAQTTAISSSFENIGELARAFEMKHRNFALDTSHMAESLATSIRRHQISTEARFLPWAILERFLTTHVGYTPTCSLVDRIRNFLSHFVRDLDAQVAFAENYFHLARNLHAQFIPLRDDIDASEHVTRRLCHYYWTPSLWPYWRRILHIPPVARLPGCKEMQALQQYKDNVSPLIKTIFKYAKALHADSRDVRNVLRDVEDFTMTHLRGKYETMVFFGEMENLARRLVDIRKAVEERKMKR